VVACCLGTVEVVIGPALLFEDGAGVVLDKDVPGNGTFCLLGSTWASHWATLRALLLLR
jgi:hypothetical protein